MNALVIMCWAIGIIAVGLVLLWCFGSFIGAVNEDKANAHLADKYDRESGR